MNRSLALALLLPFAALTTWSVMKVGYLGIFTGQFHPGGWQVLVDLVIACTLCMAWMWQHAQANGRNVWPFIAITVFLGSFGPLLYWLTNPSTRKLG